MEWLCGHPSGPLAYIVNSRSMTFGSIPASSLKFTRMSPSRMFAVGSFRPCRIELRRFTRIRQTCPVTLIDCWVLLVGWRPSWVASVAEVTMELLEVVSAGPRSVARLEGTPVMTTRGGARGLSR